MSDIQRMIDKVNRFRDERNWRQFHKPKDVAVSLCLEAAELLEHFQWKDGDELERYLKEHKEDVADEIVDVLHWVLVLSHDLGIDLVQAQASKLKKTEKKYPIKKNFGNNRK